MINKKEMKNFLITNLSFFTLNFVLFVFILIGIQNNHSKKKVLFLNYESIEMPISFISGSTNSYLNSHLSESDWGGFQVRFS